MSTELQYADANGLRIAYQTFGDPSRPAVLLIMGLGAQMIAWGDELCAAIAAHGHHVIRFDNRDVGLSTHLDGTAVPSPAALLLHRDAPPYTIEEMAADAVGLLDALGIEEAHVVGASMGGFIAQALALGHRSRVRSMTLIMTSTGSRRVGYPTPAVLFRLFHQPELPDRASTIDAVVRTFRVIGSPGYPVDEEFLRDVAARSYDRSHDREGYRRQLAASMVHTNRTAGLRRLDVPTTVIHGLADPLINPNGGLALARAIPGARFVGFSGMGHDLPRPLWPQVADEIALVAARADRSF